MCFAGFVRFWLQGGYHAAIRYCFLLSNQKTEAELKILNHCFLLPIRTVVSIPHSIKQCTKVFLPRPVSFVLCVL
jgi:prephenate dehydratase